MLSKKFKLGILVASLVHAAFLIYLTFSIMNSKIVHWDDAEIAKGFHLLKNTALKLEKKPPQQDFLFIDVSASKELIPKIQDSSVIGNEDITNRATLAKLFTVFNQYDYHKLILCDIRFWKKAASDSLLKPEIEKTKRLLCSTHYQDGKIQKPIFNVPYSVSDYENTGDFLKIRMVYGDTVKTTPVSIFEQLENQNVKPDGKYFYVNGKRYFNNFILDFRILPHHYDSKINTTTDGKTDTNDYKIPKVYIDEFLRTAQDMQTIAMFDSTIDVDGFFKAMFKDRIIVVGDFSDRDIHGTLVGDMAGPAILLNAYLALKEGDNIIDWKYLLYLYICFFCISYILFYPDDFFQVLIKKITKSEILQSLLSAITFFLLLILISLVGYIIFGFQFSVILLIIYVKVVDWVIHLLLYKKLIRTKPTLLENGV